MKEKHLAILRRHMVERIEIAVETEAAELGKEKLDDKVMAAMMKVPRHLFVPEPLIPFAYENTPLPIGFGKTISQPFIVAVMTDMLEPHPDDTILEVGTGLGYQASILAELGANVWTVEVVEELASEAENRLKQLGYDKVGIRIGSGAKGWSEHAPYDRIIVTAAAETVPEALVGQLKPGGRMVLPVGPPDHQKLTLVVKDAKGKVTVKEGMAVRFSLLETVI